MTAGINRRTFSRFIRDYKPFTFEILSSTDRLRYRIPMHHALKNRNRLEVALLTASRYIPERSFKAVDLGAYPGSFLRLLRYWFDQERCCLIGCGLMVSDEFRRTMVESCGAAILTVNLDPNNQSLKTKEYPSKIPLDNGNVEFVFAMEVIEHLVSPSHLLVESFRILAPGGHLLVTTPNVTRIGNILKLLVGRSNFDRLIPLDYDHPEDEWRPHFREYTLPEVSGMLQRTGFQVIEARYYQADDTQYNVKRFRQCLIDLFKIPFYMIPHFRGEILVIGRKPVDMR